MAEVIDESSAEEVESGSEHLESDVEQDLDEVDSDAESVDEDTTPRQKLQINNQVALQRIRESIQLDPSLSWTETLTVSYPHTLDVDVDNDLDREVAFYKHGLASALAARTLASTHDLPFTRPPDFFAEMVKSDAHMERIRQRLLDERAAIKRTEDKRKERQGKKFGKQVQIEKVRQRERDRKDVEDRLKGIKRKRKGALDSSANDGDAFDVAVEDAISDRPSKRGKGHHGGRDARSSGNAGKMNHTAREKKHGKGGDKSSSKGHGQKRLGKSKRIAARSKR